jgi:hypothetical protein
MKKDDQRKWKDIKQQRKFFDEYAVSKQFDPLDAEKWYSISKKDIIRAVSICGFCNALSYNSKGRRWHSQTLQQLTH